MKIGIMGGTFDPIHNGHLTLGETAYRTFDLDEVWFMPNGNPPHKASSSICSDVTDRVEMVRLAIAGHDGFRLQEYESLKKEVSCSYDTLEHFHKVYKGYQFYFIVGADSLFAIETWVHPERIFPLCTILAAYRDEIDTRKEMYRQIHYLKGKYDASIELLEAPIMDISSSDLRESLKKGRNISNMVPEKVEQYIRVNHLYKEEPI